MSRVFLIASVLALAAANASAQPPPGPMLRGAWVPDDPHRIDFDKLPRVPVRHAVVSDVRGAGGVNQHNYLARFDGRFWVMWSDGPGVEDRVGQVVKYATSADGLSWDAPRSLTPYPPGSGPDSPHYNTRTDRGLRYIARGFWVRDGELLALASLDEAAGFFGLGLALHAFRRRPGSGGGDPWEDLGLAADDAINNFPPDRLPGGAWGMSRRTHDYKTAGVQFLIGGLKSIDDWASYPVAGAGENGLSAEEPLWWALPDGRLASLFRDNRRGGYLYRSFSADGGKSWGRPARTNFPDATSKLHGLRLSDGRYALVSNPHPKRRDPLTLALSDDGLTFDRMFYLVGGRHVDYPHMIEHDGYLYVAHSGGKRSVEVERVSLADLDSLRAPGRPLAAPADGAGD